MTHRGSPRASRPATLLSSSTRPISRHRAEHEHASAEAPPAGQRAEGRIVQRVERVLAVALRAVPLHRSSHWARRLVVRSCVREPLQLLARGGAPPFFRHAGRGCVLCVDTSELDCAFEAIKRLSRGNFEPHDECFVLCGDRNASECHPGPPPGKRGATIQFELNWPLAQAIQRAHLFLPKPESMPMRNNSCEHSNISNYHVASPAPLTELHQEWRRNAPW